MKCLLRLWSHRKSSRALLSTSEASWATTQSVGMCKRPSPDPRSGGPMPDLVIRPAVQDDLEVLWDFLAMAAYEPDADAAKAVPSVAKYIVGWRRPGDFGFIAEHNGNIIGAVWGRRFSADPLTFHFGDEETPKVSIGVKPNARGQGVGEQLMRALIGEAVRRGLGLCLSVRAENPARHLYERLGFRDIPGSAITNRAGGTSIGMALRR